MALKMKEPYATEEQPSATEKQSTAEAATARF
jgi:hypothetical protein